MLTLLVLAAHAEPRVLVAHDPTEERVVLHEPDGAMPVFRVSDGARLMTLDGPRALDTLAWRGETLVGTGPDGTFVWETVTGRLLHGYASTSVVAVSDDGRWLATGRVLVRIGDPVPLATWPDAEAVAFSDDGGHVATLHGGQAVMHPLPAADPPPRARRGGERR